MIHRLMVSSFMGIKAAAYDFDATGAVFAGPTASGKTSVLKAIRAALVAQDIDPSAIHHGADEAEILLDVDDVTVRRAINAKGGTSLTVVDGHGSPVKKPQGFLAELLGIAPLDPIDLFMEKDPKKRRARILSAIPVAVNAEQLAKWVPPGADLVKLLGPDGRGGPNVNGHGLEVVDKLRRTVYAERTVANRAVEVARGDVDGALAKVANAERAAKEGEGVDFDAATRELEAARAHAASLAERRRLAERQTAQHETTRKRVADLRARASKARTDAPLAPSDDDIAAAGDDVRQAGEAVSEAQAAVDELRAMLVDAEAALATATKDHETAKARATALEEQQAAAEQAVQSVADLSAQAAELEAAIGHVEQVSAEDERAATQRIEKATADVARGRVGREARDALARAREAKAVAEKALADAETRAKELDASVKALTNDAPRALLAAADGIPGLTVDGDDVLLDGVSIDRLSGGEQLRFACDVAKRLNAKSKLLIVDGLERLDSAQRRTFLAHAVDGGFQCIATRVADTPFAVEPVVGEGGAS